MTIGENTIATFKIRCVKYSGYLIKYMILNVNVKCMINPRWGEPNSLVQYALWKWFGSERAKKNINSQTSKLDYVTLVHICWTKFNNNVNCCFVSTKLIYLRITQTLHTYFDDIWCWRYDVVVHFACIAWPTQYEACIAWPTQYEACIAWPTQYVDVLHDPRSMWHVLHDPRSMWHSWQTSNDRAVAIGISIISGM